MAHAPPLTVSFLASLPAPSTNQSRLAIRRSNQSALSFHSSSFRGRLSFTTTASHVTIFSPNQAPPSSVVHRKDKKKT